MSIHQQVPEQIVQYLKERGVRLPKFSELAEPWTISKDILDQLRSVDRHSANPLNLFRVNWYNNNDTGQFNATPDYIEIPKAFSGVNARIIVMLGDQFPMISAHKVLPAYTCLVPRLLQGTFDPTHHRAIWPSTGNYCRGGVAISRILGCRSVAVLPEGMSKERFDWLEEWVTEPSDIIRTYGSESNVKEIYDECAKQSKDAQNVIINQFAEFGNYLGHYYCTGRAASHLFQTLSNEHKNSTLSAFVSATGSAGTIGAGDYLKEQHGSDIVAVEATECPTMLHNGFGEHNIQGIGDKHIPYIHNVMNTDCIVGISDQSSDGVYLILNSDAGRNYLKSRHGLSEQELNDLSKLGLSGVANVLASCRYARHHNLEGEDIIITVATDSAELYKSQIDQTIDEKYHGIFEAVDAAEICGEHLRAINNSELLELNRAERNRIFNLGYYTWVEQQGVEFEEFESRRSQYFWRSLHANIEVWDQLIDDLNKRTAV